MTLKNLSIERKLGSFLPSSNVMLVRNPSDQKLFAMKIIKIDGANKETIIQYCQAIRKCPSTTSFVQVMNAFLQEENFYLILEYMSNGEFLRGLTHRLNEESCKFYMAELVFGLEQWYKDYKGFYKPLSPENILMDPQQHIKLSNYGVYTPLNAFNLLTPFSPLCRTGSCKRISGSEEEDQGQKEGKGNIAQAFFDIRAKCAGKELLGERLGYYPPEILSNKDLDEKSDAWMVGIIMYECLTGKHLISVQTPNEFQGYLDEETEVSFVNRSMSENCQDLIRKLVKKKPEERLSISDVKKHAFMNGINWEKVASREGNGPLGTMQRKIHHRSDGIPRK